METLWGSLFLTFSSSGSLQMVAKCPEILKAA
jgi:hypothetical protein